jgi:hypothetical protein
VLLPERTIFYSASCNFFRRYIAGSLLSVRTAASYGPHLRSCEQCRALYPQIVQALHGFDQAVFDTLRKLLDNWSESLDITEERIGRFVDFHVRFQDEDEELRETERERLRSEWVLRLWKRAAALGFHIGYCMQRYECSHVRVGDSTLWLGWRQGLGDKAAAQFVQELDDSLYELLIAAKILFDSLGFAAWSEDFHYDPLLWLPADDDLKRIDGILHVDETATSRSVTANWGRTASTSASSPCSGGRTTSC